MNNREVALSEARAALKNYDFYQTRDTLHDVVGSLRNLLETFEEENR